MDQALINRLPELLGKLDHLVDIADNQLPILQRDYEISKTRILALEEQLAEVRNAPPRLLPRVESLETDFAQLAELGKPVVENHETRIAALEAAATEPGK